MSINFKLMNFMLMNFVNKQISYFFPLRCFLILFGAFWCFLVLFCTFLCFLVLFVLVKSYRKKNKKFKTVMNTLIIILLSPLMHFTETPIFA